MCYQVELKPVKIVHKALFLQLWEKFEFYSQGNVFLHASMFILHFLRERSSLPFYLFFLVTEGKSICVCICFPV